MKIEKPMSWDEVANEYDKLFGGRRARTLQMDIVFDRLAERTDRFYVSEEGTIHKVEESEEE